MTPTTRISTLLALTLAAALAGCAVQQPAAPSTVATPARHISGHSPEAFIASHDLDRDGRVTRAEYDAVRAQRFGDADTNGDGWLNEAEYVTEFETRLKRQYFDEGKEPDERYDAAMKQAYVRFAVVDRDRDGRFTLAEEQALAQRSFEQADTNGDGVVDRNDPPRQRQRDGDGESRSGTAPSTR